MKNEKDIHAQPISDFQFPQEKNDFPLLFSLNIILYIQYDDFQKEKNVRKFININCNTYVF